MAMGAVRWTAVWCAMVRAAIRSKISDASKALALVEIGGALVPGGASAPFCLHGASRARAASVRPAREGGVQR